MSVTDQLLANNAVYAENFTGPLTAASGQARDRGRLHGRAGQ
ncbi:hypothetical protein [Streptomyces sp. H27-G5]|nr:hypothetical protein [Streptomyces sp. H27-G5]